MGYKMCTPGVQIFVGYKRSEWGTVGNPGHTYLFFVIVKVFSFTHVGEHTSSHGGTTVTDVPFHSFPFSYLSSLFF